MNYLKHYIKLVRQCKNRSKIKGVHEGHHIFPESIYGKNKLIVFLTYREHYIAHKLLWKIYRKRYGSSHWKTRKMASAFHWMVYGKNKRHQERSNSINSTLYSSARKAIIEAKTGKKRKDMEGKQYFGASEKTIKIGIRKMVAKKTGMKINYTKNRIGPFCSKEKAAKISESRNKTKEKYINMSEKEFIEWLDRQTFFSKLNRFNSNISRALKWRGMNWII